MALRKILFRGKRLDNNEWIEGDLCRSIQDGKFCIMPVAFFATRDLGCEDKDENPIISDSMAIGGFFPVITETIGEFTGKFDNAGNKVFEGDLFEHVLNTNSLGIVFNGEYKNCFDKFPYQQGGHVGFYVEFGDEKTRKDLSYWCENSEVVRNIHDNQIELF